jgi:hypothetical protein
VKLKLILVTANLLVAGCASQPAPQACWDTLYGSRPFPKDHGQWWNSQCAGRMGGGGPITHSDVAPLRFRYQEYRGGQWGLEPY